MNSREEEKTGRVGGSDAHRRPTLHALCDILLLTGAANVVACTLPNPCPSNNARGARSCIEADDGSSPIETKDGSVREQGSGEAGLPVDAQDTGERKMDAASRDAPDVVEAGDADGGASEASDIHDAGDASHAVDANDASDAGDAKSPDSCIAPSVLTQWEVFRRAADRREEPRVCSWSKNPSCTVSACATAGCTDAGAGSNGCHACDSDPGTPWPGNEVPVCFTAEAAARSDAAWTARFIRDIVEASWPAFADIEFTGWGVCTPGARGAVPLNALNDQRAAFPFVGSQGSDATYPPVELGTFREDSLFGFFEHAMGHVLGFRHEMHRPLQTQSADACYALGAAPPTTDVTLDERSSMLGTDYGLGAGPCYNRDLSRWDIVAARQRYGARADRVVSTGSEVYTRKRSTGDIYVLKGASWSKVSGPVGQLVAVGSTLYALNSDLSRIFQRSADGTDWTPIGYEARELLNCAGQLCAVLPSGDLVRFKGGKWTWLGDRANKYVATSTQIYRLTWARAAVEEYVEAGDRWVLVRKEGAGTIYATSSELLVTDSYTGAVSRYTGKGTDWEPIGGEGRNLVGVGTALYAHTPNRAETKAYTTSGWVVVAGPLDWIYGAPDALYAIDPQSKDIMRYAGGTWQRLGQP